MSAQPYGLDPDKTEFWAGEQSWGDFRMYWSEAKARQYSSAPWLRDEDGQYLRDENGKPLRGKARIFKVTMNWEEA